MTADQETNVTLVFPRYSSGQDSQKPVIVRTPIPAELPPNHILLKVDRFGFSANNVTYQVLGEEPHFRYYDFHCVPVTPDEKVSPVTHGLVPVWGFGTVVRSTHPGVRTGERLFGYLATARYLVIPISPSDVNKHAVYVPRLYLPGDRRPYNQLLRCSTDPQYDPAPQMEDLTMLYRPLFWTSFWCEDWFFKSGYRGASNILISSASSKTAFCLAYLIRKRFRMGEISRKRIIGLTSKRNTAFTIGLGLYDDVVDYDYLATSASMQVSPGDRWMYVDLSANYVLNKAIFDHLGPNLVASIELGLTNLSPSTANVLSANWTPNALTHNSDKRKPSDFTEAFFMVEWLNVRRQQLTPQDMHRMQNTAWKELMRDCAGWVRLERVFGAEDVKRAYERVAKDGFRPNEGCIWSLWEHDGDTPHTRSKL